MARKTQYLLFTYSEGPNSSVYALIKFSEKSLPYTALLGPYEFIEFDF